MIFLKSRRRRKSTGFERIAGSLVVTRIGGVGEKGLVIRDWGLEEAASGQRPVAGDF